MRPIDLDELLKFPIRLDHYDKENGDEHFAYGVEAVLEYAENLPVVEAEPVRHGRWETWGYVFHGIEWKRCSCCGKCADVSYYGLLDGEIRMSTPAICGGCGADMREEGANNEHQV